VRLVLCGPDDEGHGAALHALVERLGAREQVVFERPVEGDDKWALLRGARVVVLASDNENFGNVVLEAMAVARPTVVTEGVGACTIVREADAGIVCGTSQAALAAALSETLTAPEQATARGERGQRFVAEHLTWERIAERMAERYADMLRKSSSSAHRSSTAPC